LLAALVLASTALYRHPFLEPMQGGWRYPYWMGLPAEPRSYLGAYLFWFLGLPLAVIVSGAWYRWRSRRLGVTIAWQWYVGVTLAVLALLAIVAAVPTRVIDSSIAPGYPGPAGLLTPLLVVAVAAIALGVVERSRGLVLGASGWG
jgi:hypothetical protein